MTPLQKIWLDKTARLRRDLGRREHEAHTNRLRAAGVRGAVARHELPFDLVGFREWLVLQACSINTEGANPLLWDCPFCDEPFDLTQLSVDHSTPLSMGGFTMLDNLLCVDKRCNTDKGELGAEEFKVLRALVMSWDSRMKGAFWRRWRNLAAYLRRSNKGDKRKPDEWLQVVRRSGRG